MRNYCLTFPFLIPPIIEFININIDLNFNKIPLYNYPCYPSIIPKNKNIFLFKKYLKILIYFTKF